MIKYGSDFSENNYITNKIITNVPDGSIVFDFGCSVGKLANYLKNKKKCKVYGVEIDNEALKIAMPYLEDGFCCDVTKFEWVNYFKGLKVDVIIFADVLEHLTNPGEVIEKALDFLNEDGFILFSIPNIAHNDLLVNLYNDTFTYTKIGLLDDTHVHFWGLNNLKDFFTLHKAFLTLLDGVSVPIFCTEQKCDVPMNKRFVKALEDRHYGNIYQFFGKAYRQDYACKNNLSFINNIPVSESKYASEVYYDDGNGFKDTADVKFSLTNNEADIEIDITSETKRIIISPVRGCSCIMELPVITATKGLEYSWISNGIAIRNYILFKNLDSQIMITFSSRNKGSLHIKYRVISVELPIEMDIMQAILENEEKNINDKAAYQEQINAFQQMENDKQRSIDELKEVIKVKGSHIAEMEEDINVKNFHIKELENNISQRDEKILLLSDQHCNDNIKIEQLEKEIEINNKRNAADFRISNMNRHALNTLLNRKADLEGSYRNLESSYRHLEKEYISLNQKLTETVAELEHANLQAINEKNAYAHEVELYRNSTSWKITKPIRKTKDFLKKIKPLVLFVKTCRLLRSSGVKATITKIKSYCSHNSVAAESAPVHIPEICEVLEAVQQPTPAAFSAEQSESCSSISFKNLINEFVSAGSTKIINEDVLREYDEKSSRCVMIVSHELQLTGAPVALRYMAHSLIKLGFRPIVFSPSEGKLADSLEADKIPVIISNRVINNSPIRKYVRLFEFAVLSTIVCSPLVTLLSDSPISVLWWIHEARVSYHEGQLNVMPNQIGNNIHIYCGGEYAQNVLADYFPSYDSKVLLYVVPDFSLNKLNVKYYDIKNPDNKIVFALIGSVMERKGQDVLASAILSLPVNIVKQCLFLFIGLKHSITLADNIDYVMNMYPENVRYIDEVSPEQLKSVYKQMDCLICASKDDPMPVVVTESLLLGKPVICSDNTGFTQFIDDKVNSFLYKNNDYLELAEKICCFVKGEYLSDSVSANARKIYDENFSEVAFDSSIKNVLRDLNIRLDEYKYDISVVVPTYNGGERFKEQIRQLKNQKNCGSMQIVVVDSGSTDGTVEFCRKNNVKVIEIPNKDFSHSYARNLGADNADGRIIAFMTQDAVPTDNTWLRKISEPVLNGEVAAASCGEDCPEGTDLYYLIASYGHSKYVGFYDRDLIGSMDNVTDNESLRKNASLNDVACVIDHDIFSRFKHRFNYAEDLDLGVRLIKNGYLIKMFSGVKVSHGHNRNADYYMKRAFVETLSLNKIMDIPEAAQIDESTVVSRLICSYNIIMKAVEEISGFDEVSDADEFFSRCCENIENRIKDKNKYLIEPVHNSFSPELLYGYLLQCYEHCRPVYHDSICNIAIGITFYFKNISDYFKEHNMKITKENIQKICNCIVKQTASSEGAYFASFSSDSDIGKMVSGLSEGV